MPNTKGEIFKDKGGEFRSRVRGNNQRIIATTEGYKNRANAQHALNLLSVKKSNTKDLTRK